MAPGADTQGNHTRKETYVTSPDPFASYDKMPAVSFKGAPIGTTYHLEVLSHAELVQSIDFETGERAVWPDGNPRKSAVVRVRRDGQEENLWAGKPSSMFAALQAAQKAAGARIGPGGQLTVKFVREEPNRKNPKLNPQKIYDATYSTGDPLASDDVPPF